MKWFKKDIKILCGTISTFWLMNRPLGDSMSEHQRVLERVRQFLAEHRVEVVCSEISGLGNLAAERSKKYQDTVDHFTAHPEVYGKSTPMMIERFSKLAAESRKDVAKAQILLTRIQTEGLPPEVMGFDPIQKH